MYPHKDKFWSTDSTLGLVVGFSDSRSSTALDFRSLGREQCTFSVKHLLWLHWIYLEVLHSHSGVLGKVMCLHDPRKTSQEEPVPVNIFPIHVFILSCVQQIPFSFLVMGDMVKSLRVWNCIPWIKFTPQIDLKEGIKPALGSQLRVKWNLNIV